MHMKTKRHVYSHLLRVYSREVEQPSNVDFFIDFLQGHNIVSSLILTAPSMTSSRQVEKSYFRVQILPYMYGAYGNVFLILVIAYTIQGPRRNKKPRLP